MDKKNSNFTKNIEKINYVCDVLMENKQERIPEVIMFRALRTIIPLDCKFTFSDDFENASQEMVEAALQVILECDDPYKWFLQRNVAIPPYTDNEKKALKEKIELIKEMHKKLEIIKKQHGA